MAGQTRVFALDVPAICVLRPRLAEGLPHPSSAQSKIIATLDRTSRLTDHAVLSEPGRIDEASSKRWLRCGGFEYVIT